jgi:hypothetical protein
MTRADSNFYGLPLELLGGYLRHERHAEAERERLLRALRRRTTGQAPRRAATHWLVRQFARLRLTPAARNAVGGGPVGPVGDRASVHVCPSTISPNSFVSSCP